MSDESIWHDGYRGALRLCRADEPAGVEMDEDGGAGMDRTLPQIETVLGGIYRGAEPEWGVGNWQARVNHALRSIVADGGDVSDVQITPLDGSMLLATIVYWAKAQDAAQATD